MLGEEKDVQEEANPDLSEQNSDLTERISERFNMDIPEVI
jgi:hypothetical protein